MKPVDTHIDISELRRRFSYCPKTGQITWKISRPPNIKPGDRAGCLFPRRRSGGAYWAIKFSRQRILAHRAAWAIYYGAWPDQEIDHINGDGIDNRIENLRECSRSENLRNKRFTGRSKSGIPGVFFRETTRQWLVKIGGEYVGCYSCLLEAASARKSMENKLGYSSRHGYETQPSKGAR